MSKTKAEWIAEAEALGIELDANETIADLEAKIKLHNELLGGDTPPALPAGAQVMRRKLNRGSTRRIERAHDAVQDALSAFIKEMDMQIFAADEDGERVAEWPFIATLREMQDAIREETNAALHPVE